MKKQTALAALLCALALGAAAQPAAPAAPGAPALSSAAERQRIDADRARLEAAFAAEDTACYEKFLVNSCLDKVRLKRNEALGDLRRQEILLNDQDRKARGAEQMRKTEEKSSPARQQEAANRRAEALRDFQGRADREKEKELGRAEAVAGEKASADAAAARLQGNQAKAVARTAKQAEAAENARKLKERQREAAERKAQREADKLKQGKPPAQSLPLPPG